MRQACASILLTAALAGPAAAQDLRTPDAREPYRYVPPVQADLRSPDAREQGASSRSEGSAVQAPDAADDAEWIYLAIAGAGLVSVIGATAVGERTRRRTIVTEPERPSGPNAHHTLPTRTRDLIARRSSIAA